MAADNQGDDHADGVAVVVGSPLTTALDTEAGQTDLGIARLRDLSGASALAAGELIRLLERTSGPDAAISEAEQQASVRVPETSQDGGQFMRSHLPVRIAAVVAALGAAAGGTVATASAANAIGGGGTCTSQQLVSYYGVSSTSPQYVYADVYSQCIPGPGETPLPVDIYKYIGGVGYELVASGKSYITYTCTGGRSLYTTRNNSGAGFSCG